MRKSVYSAALFLLSLSLALGAVEIVLRVMNSSMKNYDIEMWRYARELKRPSANPVLGHEHIRNASAVLQSVTIRTNDWGLRGPPLEAPRRGARRILFLGDSITLGWGVREADVLTSRLESMFADAGERVEVLNAGVGNYNAERYVTWFLRDLKGLEPTDIVVHYFLRSAEKLDTGGGNIVLRNSELALTMWVALHRLLDRAGEKSLLDHYRAVYAPDQPGWIAAQASLKKLAQYAKDHHMRIFLAMMPDIHNLKNYQLGFVHDLVRNVALENGYTFIDLLPAFGTLAPEQVWAMPGDPHPNALGHELMASALYPVLAAAAQE
jgi:lysophospholipase L1-like esterase